MKKNGRPTLFSWELAQEICDRLGNGESLVAMCEDDHMPAENTIYGWLTPEACEHSERFLKMYNRARRRQGDAYADATVKIADDLEKIQDDGSEYFGSTLSARSRVAELRVKARQWHAARLRPRKYGDQVNTNNKTKVDANVSLTNVEEVRGKLFDKLTPPPVKVEGVEIMANEIHVNSDETNSGT